MTSCLGWRFAESSKTQRWEDGLRVQGFMGAAAQGSMEYEVAWGAARWCFSGKPKRRRQAAGLGSRPESTPSQPWPRPVPALPSPVKMERIGCPCNTLILAA